MQYQNKCKYVFNDIHNLYLFFSLCKNCCILCLKSTRYIEPINGIVIPVMNNATQNINSNGVDVLNKTMPKIEFIELFIIKFSFWQNYKKQLK